ncbi:putative 37S ribosomal protein S18 [Paramyrothecium foliicola]|nr:putative 37S ribosomal protein S18 [Paramyrothecium foliicola]
MSRSLTSRFAAQSLFRCPRGPITKSFYRSLSSTPARWEDKPGQPPAPKKIRERSATNNLLDSLYGSPQNSANQSANPLTMDFISKTLDSATLNASGVDTRSLTHPGEQTLTRPEDEIEPYHFHIYSHKHNTHITCTKPSREPIISMSCGNIGFKKSRRGTFDAAYSLTKYVLERMIHTGWPPKIQRLEVVLRGFGQGRDAAVKVLMSPEGKILRDKIIRVADNTRIKFAGTRGEKRRRL